VKSKAIVPALCLLTYAAAFSQEQPPQQAAQSDATGGRKPGQVLSLPTVTAPEPVITVPADAPDYEIFQNKSGGVTLTGYHGKADSVVIPGAIGGQPVTVIGPRAFAAKGLKSVTIPENVDTIAFCAFAENGLESISLPQSLVSIEYEAFASNALSSVSLPENVASVGVRAFADNRLSAIDMPLRLSYIGKDAFKGNEITRVTLAEKRNLWTSQGFELSFINYYNANGRKAGTYIKAERVWSEVPLKDENP
jgi:hypothetical protein